MITVIGTPVSPYVRKILAALHLKGLPFEIDPITPFFGDDEFARLSPLRRIPVFIDGDVTIADSSVILQYIDETWPQPPLLPPTARQRAHARWLEEFSDTRVADVFISKGFGAMVVAPAVFGAHRDIERFKKHLETDVAEVMDYLETVAPAEGFLAGPFGLADISVAVMFRNMKYARWTPDPARWPKTTTWLERAEAQESLVEATKWSDVLAKTSPPEQRAKANELGLSLTTNTRFGDRARRGPMTPFL